MKAFIKKVEAERALLRAVNEHHIFPELTGTSVAVVETWRSRSNSIPKDLGDEVIRAAEMISGLVERSGERFNLAEASTSTDIRTAIDGITRRLAPTND